MLSLFMLTIPEGPAELGQDLCWNSVVSADMALTLATLPRAVDNHNDLSQSVQNTVLTQVTFNVVSAKTYVTSFVK